MQAEEAARGKGLLEASASASSSAAAGAKVGDENPTEWWPHRTEFAQAMAESDSKIGGEEADEFWWLANAPWFLPPPPEWGPIKPQMYANYYFKPIHHQYEMPNVQGKNVPFWAPHYQDNLDHNAALGADLYGRETFPRNSPQSANGFNAATNLPMSYLTGQGPGSGAGPISGQVGGPVPVPYGGPHMPETVGTGISGVGDNPMNAGPGVMPDHPFSTMGIDLGVTTADGVATMGTPGVPGAEEIMNYGDKGAIGGYGTGNAPYVAKECNPYFPQSCGAFHSGWHPEAPREAEFYPPQDAPSYGPEASHVVPPLGGSEAFIELESEVSEAAEEAASEEALEEAGEEAALAED